MRVGDYRPRPRGLGFVANVMRLGLCVGFMGQRYMRVGAQFLPELIETAFGFTMLIANAGAQRRLACWLQKLHTTACHRRQLELPIPFPQKYRPCVPAATDVGGTAEVQGGIAFFARSDEGYHR